MHRNGLIKFRPEVHNAQESFLHEIELANQYFVRAGRRSGAAMAAATACMLLVVAAQRHGVFPSLTPTLITSRHSPLPQRSWAAEWTKDAYQLWWANFSSPVAGWLVYFAIGTVGLYFIITMNVIGGRVVILVWRTRHLIEYGSDPDNRDGYYGWLPVRRILAPTYTALAVHGFAIFLSATMIPPAALPFLIPVGGQWLLVLGPYLFVPAWLVAKNIVAYKEQEISRLAGLLDSLAAKPMTVARERDRETVAQRVERVRNIPPLPFRRARDLLVLWFTILASAASIYGAAALWYNIT
jgi:hypothetical protein